MKHVDLAMIDTNAEEHDQKRQVWALRDIDLLTGRTGTKDRIDRWKGYLSYQHGCSDAVETQLISTTHSSNLIDPDGYAEGQWQSRIKQVSVDVVPPPINYGA